MYSFFMIFEIMLISEMSKFETEGPKKGVNRRIDSQKSLHQVV